MAEQQQQHWSDAWVDFVAGWCSGAAAVIALQPVDTILTRWQAGVLITATPTGQHIVAGEARALTTALGLKALWRGASPMITAVPFQNALLMGGYGVGQGWYEKGSPEATSSKRWKAIFIGGCAGGVLQSFLMSPVELIKVNQQCRAAAVTAASKEVFSQLLRGSPLAWRGLGATLLRDGIPHGVWFVSYEACKQYGLAYYKRQKVDATGTSTSDLLMAALTDPIDSDDDDDMPVAVPLLSGAVAATVAWGVGYPADLIKTRLQYDKTGKQGIFSTARVLVQEANGNVVSGLYRGFGMKLVRSVPASMIGFGVYEFVKQHIQKL